MDATVAEYLAVIVSQARLVFDQVEATIDATPERAILRVQANYGIYRVLVVELLSGRVRKYRYYVLNGDFVAAGFDNSADPRAIRLKYGRIDEFNAGQMIPHLHLNNKTDLILTEEVDFAAFVVWLRANLPPDGRGDEY